MNSHVGFLRSIGMVVNASKTELLFSSRRKHGVANLVINCNGSEIKSKPKMKVLGTIFSDDLSWTNHIDHVLSRSQHTIKKIKFLSKWLTKKELLQLVTSQYMPVVFYAAPLWIGSINADSWRRLNSAHYRAIRAALQTRIRQHSRDELDALSRRASPSQWARYIVASTVIKLFNNSDSNIADVIRRNAYINDRMPLKAKFIDKSRLKIGRQSLPNRIGPIFSKISFDWINPLSDDTLRRHLKHEFFPQYPPLTT